MPFVPVKRCLPRVPRLEAEVRGGLLRAGRVRVELRRDRDVADIGAVQPVDADPGLMSRLAKPSEVMTAFRLCFVSVNPSGSRLPVGYGVPSGCFSVVTDVNVMSSLPAHRRR